MDSMGGVPNLLKLSQIAETLNVSEKTIYYWVGRNEIPFVKIGRHLRFNFQAVLAYFESQTRDNKRVSPEPFEQYGVSRSLKIRTARNRSFASSEKE